MYCFCPPTWCLQSLFTDYCECVTSFGAVLKPLHVGKDSKRNGKNKSLYLSHAVLQFLTPDLSVKSFLKVLLGVSIT